jgi:hypothetical protein
MSAAGDPDLVNQTFEDPLGRAGFGLVDGFPDRGGDGGELFGCRACGCGGDQVGQFLATLAKLVGLVPVGGDALDGVCLVEPVLDCGQEPVGASVESGEFGVDGVEFGVDGVEFGTVGAVDALGTVGRGGDGFVDEVGTPVGVDHRVEDGLFELLGG